MTMWHVPYGGTVPHRVDVAKLTRTSCVLEDGTRISRGRVFDTWASARCEILSTADENVAAAEAHLQRMVSARSNILALTEPEET